MKIAIIYGGYSSEKDASAENAKYIDEALREKGYETCLIPYERNLVETIHLHKVDIVYVCVQGKGHGDGTIQSILEHEKIPFTGSGAHAAALINDKIISKLLFEQVGIVTPRWQMLSKEVYESGGFDAKAFGYPLVAKAPSEGGSFGIELIRNEGELNRISKVFEFESPILIEEFIPGDFYTIGVLEREDGLVLLPCVQGIELRDEKENDNPNSLKAFTGDYTARLAKLPAEVIEQMQDMAKKAFEITGAKAVARIDFMVAQKDLKPYVLEINAVPGLKPRSLLPKAAAMAGIAYNDLIEGVLLTKKNEVESGGR